ncbi:hypothetical protein Avbf_10264 [Armadillidium vulgare]|nr:hypothetical protein Avbf_10264 [Armadillidium vulgare]
MLELSPKEKGKGRGKPEVFNSFKYHRNIDRYSDIFDSIMEDIVSCDICAKEFDSLHVIPKILECGHTFCSPCLTIIIRQNPSCPNCRTEIKGTEGSLPINYNTLRVVDIYKSKGWSENESEIITSIENMKRNCMERIEILSKKKSSITSSLEVLNHCLAKLEELTVSVNQRVDNLNVKIIFKEVEENLKKTDEVVRCEDIKNSVSILLSDFQDSKEYLAEIYARVQNEEKVFAVRKIEDTIKYGKVSKYGNRLFFHSLSLSEAPTDSSLIWFDELKQCANVKNFHTFIEICCSKKNLTHVFIIKMFDKQQSHHFIKLCTGEYGLSYKGCLFQQRR